MKIENNKDSNLREQIYITLTQDTHPYHVYVYMHIGTSMNTQNGNDNREDLEVICSEECFIRGF